MQDILEHAIRTVPHRSGPYFLPCHKVKFSARKNASEGYSYDCGLFHIVAIMDTALLKSGKEGYALGCHALYGTGFQEPISLHGLKQATVRADAPGRISVLYEDGTAREENGRRYAVYLCGVLNDIAQNLAECAPGGRKPCPTQKKRARRRFAGGLSYLYMPPFRAAGRPGLLPSRLFPEGPVLPAASPDGCGRPPAG